MEIRQFQEYLQRIVNHTDVEASNVRWILSQDRKILWENEMFIWMEDRSWDRWTSVTPSVWTHYISSSLSGACPISSKLNFSCSAILRAAQQLARLPVKRPWNSLLLCAVRVFSSSIVSGSLVCVTFEQYFSLERSAEKTLQPYVVS